MDDEFFGIDFKSPRLEKRFIKTMKTLCRQPDKSIFVSSESRAESKAIYRMLGNDLLNFEEIKRVHKSATIRRISDYGGTILAVQDTSSINYKNHSKTEGLGYSCDKTLGINLHTCLAVTTDGLVMGLLDQSSITRLEKNDESATNTGRKHRKIEDKESYRWLETMRKSCEDIPPNIKVINVCDREGDVYELFEEASTTSKLFLIRIFQNRTTVDNKKIVDEIRQKTPQGQVRVAIPRDSRRNIKAREAELDVSFCNFKVKKPETLKNNKELQDSLDINVVYVKERQKDEKIEPIEWILATNEPVKSLEEAYEKVEYYMQRWKIERFHYVLKSGCTVEKIQERSVDKITTLILMYSIIAVFIMNLTYVARINPELPCSVLFCEDEWKLLYCMANKTKKPPQKPYSIKDAVTYLGQLGGPKRAPSDGPPGLQIIWMGLSKLYLLLEYKDFLV
jgi:hypothetical protein